MVTRRLNKTHIYSLNKVDEINLDVHALSHLNGKQIPVTADSFKYEYESVSDDPQSEYKFSPCTGTIVAIRFKNEFVESISSGQKAGIVLDRTNFYAESGGQIYDQGVLIKIDDEENVSITVEVIFFILVLWKDISRLVINDFTN